MFLKIIFTAVFIMSNLSTNSVEQAKETCLYLENPNVAINDSLELNQTDLSDGEDFEGISRCSFLQMEDKIFSYCLKKNFFCK